MNFILLALIGVIFSPIVIAGTLVSKNTTQYTCPSGVASESGTIPVIMIEGKPVLIVCGTPDEAQSEKGKILLVGFEIYSVMPKTQPKLLLQYSELEQALFLKKGNELQVDSLIYFEKNWIPAFRMHYSRLSGSWQKSKDVLILKIPQKESGEQTAEVKKLVAKASARQGFDEIEVAQIFESALKGNSDAKGFFTGSKSKFKLDGASAEEFDRDKQLLRRVKAASALNK